VLALLHDDSWRWL